ncbi:MAG: transcriptional regulator [Actinomycetota bacterium]
MVPSDPELLVLHAVRLVGFVDAPAVAERLDLPLHEVERHLANASADGFARHRTGARTGWSLTDEGRKENERLLADELDRSGHRPVVEAAYRRFVDLNRRVLAICTDWQVRDVEGHVLNDHTDAEYDRAVIGRLAEADAEATPLLAELAGSLARYAGYGPRLGRALTTIRSGDHDWFTRPTIDSYHTVWFELHEDLLATLGLDRSSESRPTTTRGS